MLAFTHLYTDLLFTVRSEVISNSVLSYKKQTKHLGVQKHCFCGKLKHNINYVHMHTLRKER